MRELKYQLVWQWAIFEPITLQEILFWQWELDWVMYKDYWDNEKWEIVSIPRKDYMYFSEEENDYWILRQYTGLKDKNWVEIYDWDIIIDNNESHSWYNKPQVVEITPYWPRTNLTDSMWDWAWKWYEVIWNIYENPELINNK